MNKPNKAKKAKSVMVLGTASSAGKSAITAAICRILKQDGYKAAPFKAQNMALNSFITSSGLEMGRAQVMQAEAAGVLPDVRMNPILLKPTGASGSQLIVNGEVRGTFSPQNYYAQKEALAVEVKQAYDSLADEYDVIVLEGAGSPAEINLRSVDIVNMGMARMIGAPCVLIGDIDRGGVFASLAGTQLLLDEQDNRHLKGTLINKFRGDVSILRPGIDEIERLMGIPCLGVVPYLDVVLDDEDSLSERLQNRTGGAIDIAAVRLPHISNFTDMNALEQYDGVSVRYVDRVSNLGKPDLLILPGTKNTMGDLKWLRESGMEAKILNLAQTGMPIFGVCGGYQMLGERLDDPRGVEEGGSMAGMGLLPTGTTFAEQKTRTRVSGRMGQIGGALSCLSGATFEGYEIHMGRTESDGEPICSMSALDGSASRDGRQSGNVYGCYVHGVFDGEVGAAIVRSLRAAKGLEGIVEVFDGEAFKNEQYDLLAKGVRDSIDVAALYRIIEEGVKA